MQDLKFCLAREWKRQLLLSQSIFGTFGEMTWTRIVLERGAIMHARGGGSAGDPRMLSQKTFLVAMHSKRVKGSSYVPFTILNKPQYCSCPLAAASMEIYWSMWDAYSDVVKSKQKLKSSRKKSYFLQYFKPLNFLSQEKPVLLLSNSSSCFNIAGSVFRGCGEYYLKMRL